MKFLSNLIQEHYNHLYWVYLDGVKKKEIMISPDYTKSLILLDGYLSRILAFIIDYILFYQLSEGSKVELNFKEFEPETKRIVTKYRLAFHPKL